MVTGHELHQVVVCFNTLNNVTAVQVASSHQSMTAAAVLYRCNAEKKKLKVRTHF